MHSALLSHRCSLLFSATPLPVAHAMSAADDEFERWLLANPPTSAPAPRPLPVWRNQADVQRVRLDVAALLPALERCRDLEDLHWQHDGDAALIATPRGAPTTRVLRLSLPPLLAPVDTGSARETLRTAACSDAVLVLLVQAGRASTGVWRPVELEWVAHKSWTTYMVKKAEGCTDQLTFDRRGGGMSTAGSRLRRANARSFFQKINSRLGEWQRDGLLQGCAQLHYSAPLRMWNEVFSTTSPRCPVDRRDPRLRVLALKGRPRPASHA